MPSIQFQLELPLGRVEEHVRTAYGTAARIVSVKEVRTGGIGGFFAHRALNVVVDVPEPGGVPTAPENPSTKFGSEHAEPAHPSASAGPRGVPAAGLAGLLADADARDGNGGGGFPNGAAYAAPAEHPTRRSARAAEDALRAEAGIRTDFGVRPDPAMRTEQPTISTQSRQFEEVLSGVQAEFGPPKPQVPDTIRLAPALSRLAGDLVVIAGLSADAADVTESLAAARGPYLRGVGGELAVPGARADDRRGAIHLRAAGVERGLPILVAFGLGRGGPSLSSAIEALRSLAPDQIWLAVDASRKPEDTVRWVSAVRAAVPVDAMAVLHGTFTTSDNTASMLGLPEGWSDTGR